MVDYTLDYPEIAFAFSPCFLTVSGSQNNIDTATLWINGGLSETRQISKDTCRFDLRPFVLASLSAQTATEVDYSKDVCPGAFKSITLYVSVEGQDGEESGTITIFGCFGGIGLVDNIAMDRRLPYNSNYPWSLDIATDSSIVSVDGLYNYALGTGIPITRDMNNGNGNFHDIDQELFSAVGDVYVSFDVDIEIASYPRNIHYFIGEYGPFFLQKSNGSDRVEHQFKVTSAQTLVTATHPMIFGVVEGRAKVTVRNLIVTKYKTNRWNPNPLDIQRVTNISERRTPTALGFKNLPNTIELRVDDSLSGSTEAGRLDQDITIYPDNRTNGIYLRWLDKYGRMCYRLLDIASEGLQVAHDNPFVSGIEMDNSYDSLSGHNADREYSTTVAQRTLKIGEQMCDKYAIQELVSLVSSQFVQMYSDNGWEKKWIRVNVVPGSYTIKGTTLQEFSLSIRLPKENIQHL